MALHYQQNADLQSFNTLAVPARAASFITIHSLSELQQVIAEKKPNQKLLVIGSGSNIILPEYIDALVVHMAIKGRTIEEDTENSVLVSLAAGENWHEAVMWSVEHHWYGIENLALIPGTVGAAPVQNIGAYGVEIKDSLVYLDAIHCDTGEIKRFSCADCEFSYRDSIFKKIPNSPWLIIRVVLALSKQPVVRLNYPALQSALNSIPKAQINSQKIASTVIAVRQSKLPDPAVIPNAGSFFKNPIISNEQLVALKQQFPTIAAYTIDDTSSKVAAGWLLENDGWKGKLVDGVTMYHKQALVLTNPNHLKSSKLLTFAALIKDSIEKKFSIRLEIEPVIIKSALSTVSQR